MAAAKIKPKIGSKNIKGTKENSKPAGKVIFKSCAKAASRINKKLESKIKAERVISLIKVSKDKEKIKS